VREPFPTDFGVSVRQRSRWILGISFQTWEQTGWAGSWAVRYTLLRDRRAPLTHLINMIGYVVLAFAIFQISFAHTKWATNFYVAPLFTSDSMLAKIAILCTCLLVYRIIQKMISVYTIYNLKQAFFSIPRLMISNMVNFFATWRAFRMYMSNKLFGTPMVWLKTAHVFPGEAELSEYKRTIEDLLISEGLVTREQIVAALEVEKGASVPLALLRLGLLDEVQFSDIWAKYSKLPSRSFNPSEVSSTLLKQFPEKQSVQLAIVPVKEENNIVTLALREPLIEGQAMQLKQLFGGKTVQPVLARPSNLEFIRSRGYPRLVLSPSRLEPVLGRLQQATGGDADKFLEALINTHATRRALPDVLMDRGMIDESVARKLWADVLGIPTWETKEFSLDRAAFGKFSAAFWWLHRMLPAGEGRILCGSVPHPAVVSQLEAKLGKVALFAELPGKVEVAARAADVGFDADQELVNRLVADGVLKKDVIPDVAEFRGLIADPIPKWLLVQKLATEEQLNKAFAAISGLPAAAAWSSEEAFRLAPILRPGFANEFGVYPIEEKNGNIRLGLSQMPVTETLQAVYDRLAGYALSFEALNSADLKKLADLMAGL
jgi:hypothetical protein